MRLGIGGAYVYRWKLRKMRWGYAGRCIVVGLIVSQFAFLE
jgi:hypothetical protein